MKRIDPLFWIDFIQRRISRSQAYLILRLFMGGGLLFLGSLSCGGPPPPPKVDLELKGELAALLVKSKAYDEAMPLLKNALRQKPKDARLHVLLGTVLREKGVYSEAEKTLQYALKINPKQSDAYAELGILYSLKQEHQKAISAHKYSIQLSAQEARYHNNLGFSLYLNRQYQDAVRSYQNAIRLAPQRKQIMVNLALAYGALKQDQDALRLLKKVLTSAEVLNTLGVIKERRGEFEQALELYKHAFKENPRLHQAQNNQDSLRSRLRNQSLDSANRSSKSEKKEPP